MSDVTVNVLVHVTIYYWEFAIFNPNWQIKYLPIFLRLGNARHFVDVKYLINSKANDKSYNIHLIIARHNVKKNCGPILNEKYISEKPVNQICFRLIYLYPLDSISFMLGSHIDATLINIHKTS